MTPEETKQYIEHRLGELGWNVHIGKAGYDKIFRFTEGTADGTDQLCHKLLSLGALQERRDITDDVVSMAMTDLTRMDEMLHRSSKAGRAETEDADLASIEQLTAVLEAKVANGEVDTEIRLPERQARSKPEPVFARSQGVAAQPKILVVDASATARAALVKALASDCQVVQAADGEQAWKILLEQTDIELLLVDLALPNLNGHELIKRVRAAISPPHLIGIPIIVITGPEGADAKLRVLMAGANDFLLKNVEPAELRARVLARHRLSKTAPRPAATADRAVRPAARPGDAKTKPRAPQPIKAPAPGAKKPIPAKGAELYTLTTEQRFPDSAAARSSHHSVIKRIYRISSTTTITLSATLLLALALAIIYVGRDNSRPATAPEPSTTVARTDETPRAPETPSVAPPTEQPVAPNEPSSEESLAQATRPATPAAPSSTPGATAPSKDVDGSRKAKADPVPSGPVPEPAPTARSRLDTPAETARPQPSPPPARMPAAPTDQVASVPPPARAAPAPSARNEEAAAAERQTAVAPPPPAAVPTTKISKEELATFLRRFTSVYEAGDVDQFLTLFADNARTNDRTGRKGIREDYDALFRATDLRRMKLGEISWEVEGGQAYGWGDFEVNVRRASDQESYAYTGSMTFVLEKLDGRLRIVRLYHGQRRAEAR